MTRDQLRQWYGEWCGERQDLSERDGGADTPHYSEWHGSDDGAVDLLHALAAELFGDESEAGLCTAG